jgi:hypothetical protein
MPIGEKGVLAIQLVIDIGSGRFVVMAHLKQHSVRPATRTTCSPTR